MTQKHDVSSTGTFKKSAEACQENVLLSKQGSKTELQGKSKKCFVMVSTIKLLLLIGNLYYHFLEPTALCFVLYLTGGTICDWLAGDTN